MIRWCVRKRSTVALLASLLAVMLLWLSNR